MNTHPVPPFPLNTPWWLVMLARIGIQVKHGKEWYVQTWPLVAKISGRFPRVASIIQATCGRRGHRISRSEWGWDGGSRIDVWCRWCNHFATIPLEEMPDTRQKALQVRALLEEGFLYDP